MKNDKILILMGRSGCGKTVISTKLIEHYGYERVRTATTRGQRNGEPDDEYRFMTFHKFFDHIHYNDFAEHYDEYFYGISRSDLEKDQKLVIIAFPKMAAEIKKEFPDAFLVYVDASMKDSVRRAIMREEILDNEKMRRISNRAVDDNIRFKDCRCDFVLKNPEGADLDDVVRSLLAAHDKWQSDIDLMKML